MSKKEVDSGEYSEDVDFIKWFSDIDKDSLSIAGGKGANLGEMYNTKIPVPPGFVVTAQAYQYFIQRAGIREKIKKLLSGLDYENTKQLDETTEKVRELIVKSEIPEKMGREILEAYENLSVEPNTVTAHEFLKRFPESIFVAVRSSATAEDLEDASFAGQQDSYLNVKGGENLLKMIKKCFASLFTSRATYYRHKKGFLHEKTSLAVVVQKMVDSDKSGVVFSKDPSFNNDYVIVEAVFGLGTGIVSGMITPDKYLVSQDLEILEKKISDKKIAVTRNAGGEDLTVNLTREKSSSQVLKDSEIKKIAEISLLLERHYKKPQDIEFALENGEIYVVQTRAITTMERRVTGISKEIKGEIVLSGLAASPGIGFGTVKIVKTLEDLQKINVGDVLVTKMTNPDMVVTMQKSSAIVTDEGGLTAHAAIVSREMGIPCIVGTHEATKKLKEGEIITVDGFNGKVYRGKVAETTKKEIHRVTHGTRTKLKVMVDLPSYAERASKTGIKSVGLLRIEGIIAESGKHPHYFLTHKKFREYEEIIFNGVSEIAKYFHQLWVRTSDIRSDEFQNLEGFEGKIEANPMLGMHGIRASLKHPELFKRELMALKRVSENGKEIGVLLPQIISVEEVQETKKYLKEVGFLQAKIGVMIETPAAVQLIKDFCEEGIDFVSFGTNDLTQYMLAIDRGNEEVQHLYNEMHPAILYQLEYVIRVAKKHNVETSICGQAGSRKEMVKFLVERKIDSISVNADAAKEISDYILELEGGKLEKKEIEETEQEQQHKQKIHGRNDGKKLDIF